MYCIIASYVVAAIDKSQAEREKLLLYFIITAECATLLILFANTNSQELLDTQSS